MTEQPYEALPPEDKRPLAWHQVWIKAITQPSENTFLNLLEREPDVSAAKAFGWVALTAFIGGILLIVANLVASLVGFGLQFDEGSFLGGSAIAIICAIPVVMVVWIIGFGIYSAIIQVVARILGGVGTYGELTYTFAAYLAPLTLIAMLLNIIPFVGWCLSSLLGIYTIVLNVMAVKATHRFDWGRAIVTSLSLVILGLLFACCLIVLASAGLIAAAPAIEDILPELLRTGAF